MSRSYLDSIRNPQPYPASDTSNPPSRARTPVSVSELTHPRAYPRPSGQSNPPSRSRTPSSIADLTNPKPYPKTEYSYDNVIVKPTAIKATPSTHESLYQPRDADKPRAKRLTKTKSTPRNSNPNTPVQSDAEGFGYQSGNDYSRQGSVANGRTGSVSSINLSLQIAEPDRSPASFTFSEEEPVRRETSIALEAEPRSSTSIDGGRPPLYADVDRDREHKAAAGAIGGPIDTTHSSHPNPLTEREKKEKQIKAGRDEEDGSEEKWYRRHEKLLWLVFFLIVICFALGLGLSVGGVPSGPRAGTFANTFGEECRYTCRNKDRYTQRTKNPLVVFAVEGLDKDLLYEPYQSYDQLAAKNIRRLMECGVHSREMMSSFASTTYPNLWTFLTGLFPASHGIYSDYMTDPNNRNIFEPRVSLDDLTEYEWYKANAKPLWQTAREQGVLSASHSWLGNNMDFRDNPEGQTIDSKPNYYQSYNRELSPRDKIDTVIKWIDQTEVDKIPQFITVFFDEVGIASREFGIYSQEANDTLVDVDEAIGWFFDTLVSTQDAKCFNVLIVSPSGIVPTSCGTDGLNNVFFLQDDLTDMNGIETTPDYLNSFARISVSSTVQRDDDINMPQELSDFLKCKLEGIGSVYTRGEMPTRLHYSSGVPDDVYVLMREGLSFARDNGNYDTQSCEYANDGYDPSLASTQSVFVAFGQDFKTNHLVREFSNLELYNLMAKLLGVTPEHNNGTMGILNGMFKVRPTFPVAAKEFSGETFCTYDSNVLMGDYKTECECRDTELDGTAQSRGDAVFSTSSSTAEKHIPFGSPKILASVSPDAAASCKLYQGNYVMSYDKALSIARYVSFTLQPGFSTVTMPQSCILSDTRLAIGENPRCSDYSGSLESMTLPVGIKQGFLMQPALALNNADEGIITSNIAPLYSEFESSIWSSMVSEYQSWTNMASTEDVNIVHGPVYDINLDGVADVPAQIAMSSSWVGSTVVPSHYFVVVTRCANNTRVSDCQPKGIDVAAYVLPHNNNGLPCQSDLDDYLLEHRASLLDVERITGLCFFPDWTTSDDESTREAVAMAKTWMMWT